MHPAPTSPPAAPAHTAPAAVTVPTATDAADTTAAPKPPQAGTGMTIQHRLSVDATMFAALVGVCAVSAWLLLVLGLSTCPAPIRLLLSLTGAASALWALLYVADLVYVTVLACLSRRARPDRGARPRA